MNLSLDGEHLTIEDVCDVAERDDFQELVDPLTVGEAKSGS